MYKSEIRRPRWKDGREEKDNSKIKKEKQQHVRMKAMCVPVFALREIYVWMQHATAHLNSLSLDPYGRSVAAWTPCGPHWLGPH